jgi:hypothetical protein
VPVRARNGGQPCTPNINHIRRAADRAERSQVKLDGAGRRLHCCAAAMVEMQRSLAQSLKESATQWPLVKSHLASTRETTMIRMKHITRLTFSNIKRSTCFLEKRSMFGFVASLL